MHGVIAYLHSGATLRLHFSEARCAKDFVDRIRTCGHPTVRGVSDAYKIKEHRTVLSALREVADM
ncbi:hypothetical protein PQB35_gp09 [Ochrobactrum phage vB_OspP_OH]|uniref:Uncharacterized protein n=1 Tax=Ochrobactrum phage vB_OspP_OH TaxID=2712957 RepID=A0A6G6XYG4_9CAUD|nr:hypothetical protein PQB35_gp09 [Ochrobactrum phage vB_OspP_OH]QIG66065.1 hypothetical protein phiOH_p09 [Ochrobactrum phage vB_OspP_OH]